MRILGTGAISGAATGVGFAALHHLLIVDIWFSVVPMMAVGAVCGATLAWSYGLLFEPASARSWAFYNLSYLGLLLALGGLSFLVFEPVTTVATLMASGGEPPSDLIVRALPFTVAFCLVAAGLISLVWARTRVQAGAVLVCCAVLVFLFGLNVSIVGLVEMSSEGWRLLGLFFGLIAAVIVGNAAVFFALERRGLFRREGEVAAGA